MVIGNVVVMRLVRIVDDHVAGFYVNGLNLGLMDVGEPAKPPNGVDDVGRLDVAGDHLGQNGLEQEEIIPADQGKLNLPASGRPL